MTGNQNSNQPCPVCPWVGKNRYWHMRYHHGFTMSDWEQMTEIEKEIAKKGVVDPRFGSHGEQLPYQTLK